MASRYVNDDDSQELESPFLSRELFAREAPGDREAFPAGVAFESPFLDVSQREDVREDVHEAPVALGPETANEEPAALYEAGNIETFGYQLKSSSEDVLAPIAELEADASYEQEVLAPAGAGKVNKMCGHVGFYGVLGRRRQVGYALAAPYRWICHLHVVRRDSNNKVTYVSGTGVLVSPRHVLTAAHFVKSASKDNRNLWVTFEATSFRAAPARNGGEPPLDAPYAKPVKVAAAWNPKVIAYAEDYALLELDKAIGTTAYAKLKNQKLLYWGSRESNGAVRDLPDQTLLDEAVYVAGYSGGANDTRLYASQGRITNLKSGSGMAVSADAFPAQAGAPVWVVVDGKHCLVGMMVGPGVALRITSGVCATLREWMKNASDICSAPAQAPQRELESIGEYGSDQELENPDASESESGCRCGCRKAVRQEGDLFDPSQLVVREHEGLENGVVAEYEQADDESPFRDAESVPDPWRGETEQDVPASEAENVIKLSKEAAAEGFSSDAAEEGPLDEHEGPSSGSHVSARILWPALGFPAVISPSAQPGGDSDATRCISCLVLTDKSGLTSEDAARFLRCVPWDQRSRRFIDRNDPDAAFKASDLTVLEVKVSWEPRNLSQASLVEFGGSRTGANLIAGALADRVEEIYKNAGLKHRFEIRVSEQASARFKGPLYQLFWNNAAAVEDAPSDEMALLLREFAKPRRQKLGKLWETHGQYLLDEYELEYGAIHAPYCKSTTARRRAEILHPVFIRRNTSAPLAIGHLTDLHVDVRADTYEQNLKAMVDGLDAQMSLQELSKDELKLRGTMRTYNNWNKSVVTLYSDAKQDSDILLLTGDLIDYGRGYWGQDATGHLQDDDLYHPDRNWFLFSWLLSRDKDYSRPVYTCLGNHDWRINPYPPFAVGAPSPANYFYKLELTKDSEDERPLKAKRLEVAHGDGYKRKYSYQTKAEGEFDLLTKETGTAVKTLLRMAAGTQSMDKPGTPAETKIESVEWYLLTINPFLDYSFSLPSGHQILMLDWAQKENVLFRIPYQGKSWAYLPWQAATAADPGPKAAQCLTTLQKFLIEKLMKAPGKAKVIGVHAPPIGPWGDWSDEDLKAGKKIYGRAKIGQSRGSNYGVLNADGSKTSWYGHPLFAIDPKDKGQGMTANYGSFEQYRDWFIQNVAESSGIRLVFSGHIHRRGLYVVHKLGTERGKTLAGERLVYLVSEASVAGVAPPAVSLSDMGRRGPLYVNTTSAGPIGNANKDGESSKVPPGYAHVQLSIDGTIECVQFRTLGDSPAIRAAQKCAVRKVS